jgi:hypothetical protein
MTSLAQSLAARNSGIQRALDFQEREQPQWGDVALRYLSLYARDHATFVAEDVTLAAEVWGLRTISLRAWGSVFVRAVKYGLIVQDGYGRSARRHASICVRWRSRIYQEFA